MKPQLLAQLALLSCLGLAAGCIKQQTVDIPSDAQPAETPGSPGVVVSNPKLITQFGGGSFSLNRARYTRYFFSLWAFHAPDAILITVPGFEGGASSFGILAKNLIREAHEQHGMKLEVWAYDRRTNQLEDLAGLDIAEYALSPEIALDWLYGDALGLSLHPALAAGPNRRAVFYNPTDDVPFLANWNTLTYSQDIDAVVERALSEAKDGNVFLGGHSAGTGFAARYAATDFDLAGTGSPEPGYQKLRGLVLIEGGGGSIQTPPDDDRLDRIEAEFDGGLFGAVRDGAPRCVDGQTACTLATEDLDCAAFANTKCTEPDNAYSLLFGSIGPEVFAALEPTGLQIIRDGDVGQVVLQADQDGIPGNNAVAQVPALGLLSVLIPPATASGAIGTFLDDDLPVAALGSFIATSLGLDGPEVDGLRTWLDIDEAVPAAAFPDNGPPPTSLPAGRWGVEREPTELRALARSFFKGGTNFADWYYGSAGLGVTSGAGGLDTSALSLDPPLGRGRRDIENLTQAPNIDIPVIVVGGSNGLTPVPGGLVPFASSIGVCTAPSCDGVTPRVVDASLPNPAFPTLGDVAGGFEVYISEGYSHVDVVTGRNDAGNNVIGPLADFIARNSE